MSGLRTEFRSDLVADAEQRIRSELRLAEQSMRDDDRIGTVVFASSASTEDPPHPKSELQPAQRIEIGRDGTDVGALADLTLPLTDTLTVNAGGRVDQCTAWMDPQDPVVTRCDGQFSS